MPRLSKIGAAALAAFGWTSGVSAVTATYLVVAGGAGGGAAGGGAAGGFRTGTLSLDPALSYTVTVGGGGATGVIGQSGATGDGTSGSDSILSTITSTGGGGGGAGGAARAGKTGGSGGGGGHNGGAGGAGNTPSTSPSQGNNGGTPNAAHNGGGGGGGASAVGATTPSVAVGGAGGAGTASSISGSSVTYAGGGGGASNTTGGAGGAGGGGAGGVGAGGAVAGTANTGGGGGGGYGSPNPGNKGGSGIVIISYVGAQQFGGGVVTSVGGNTIHTFTTSGTLVPVTPLTANFLVIAGGGGGGYQFGGGGGAGGLLSGSSLTIDSASTYLVTVGAGGAGATATSANGVSGSNSTFSMVSTAAVGGGGGGSRNGAGSSGGSGGGGAGDNSSVGGSATSGQGFAGGTGSNNTGDAGGGGGGSGAAGSNAATTVAGAGGVGTASSISGTSTYYAGGGGGAGTTPAAGGNGGGGAGKNGSVGTAGTANTGGGGGASYNTYAAGAGGSGIVIISYPGSTQQMAGGTVTITGGNVIHTFTSSGYLAPIKYVSNSLRFRSSASAYLSRTPATATNQRTWSWSAWVKRGALGTEQMLFEGGIYSGSTEQLRVFFTSTDNLEFNEFSSSAYQFRYVTTAVYRDPSAWYHILAVLDTTNSVGKLYVNGVQVTAFSTSTAPALNFQGKVNSVVAHDIGRRNGIGTPYFDGYMTEINFIDGQALTPNSFGTINSYGVWQPITYGGSYGTNGFYLPFKTNASSYVGSFNGSNQYLSIASNSVFNQSGDFTIEYYAYLNANTNYQVIVGRGTGFITIQHSSDANAMIRLVRYGQATIATGGNVTAGKWNHFAIVRSGSTVTGYLNGIAVVSGTDSTSTATGNALAIGQNSDGTNYFAGQISNVRYTNTAVYTSNFTPSTSALTAVSGTQLLTLQNSSIVDNSTNALSITNNNSVTTGQTYPFAYTIFNDQGPAGNNWTPTNVSGAFGSTLDYMTDVPTLTSATAANYCVINPLDFVNTKPTVTNGNLQYANATNSLARGTFGLLNEKVYWEFTQVSTVDGSNPMSYGAFGLIGKLAHDSSAQSVYAYTDNGVAKIFQRTTASGVAATVTPSSFTVSVGDIIQIAYDGTNGKIWIGKNNSWYDSSGGQTGNPSTGANPVFTLPDLTNPMAPGFDHAGAPYTVALNCGQRPFTYTPPSGFVALNTYNL